MKPRTKKKYCFAMNILNTTVKNNFLTVFRDFIYMCKYEYPSIFVSVCRGQEKASDSLKLECIFQAKL